MKSQSAKRKLLWPLLAVVPASLAVAGALVYRRYRRDLKAARARIASGSKLVNTPSGLIEFADVGTGAPVLVIHGAGGGFDQGLEFARPLFDADTTASALHADQSGLLFVQLRFHCRLDLFIERAIILQDFFGGITALSELCAFVIEPGTALFDDLFF